MVLRSSSVLHTHICIRAFIFIIDPRAGRSVKCHTGINPDPSLVMEYCNIDLPQYQACMVVYTNTSK